MPGSRPGKPPSTCHRHSGACAWWISRLLGRDEDYAHRDRNLQIDAGGREGASFPVDAELHNVARVLILCEQVVAAGVESEMPRVFSANAGLTRGGQLAIGADG